MASKRLRIQVNHVILIARLIYSYKRVGSPSMLQFPFGFFFSFFFHNVIAVRCSNYNSYYYRKPKPPTSTTSENKCKLRTFALIVYAHPYYARNSCCNATSCTSARAKEEIYSHEGMVAVALTLLRFNSLGWSVTATFFWIDDFLY